MTYKKISKPSQLVMVIVIIFLSSIGFKTNAQSLPAKPGNTAYGVELWLKADDVLKNGSTTLPVDGSLLDIWKDHSRNTRDHESATGVNAKPSFNSSDGLLNFQPAIRFSNTVNRLVYDSSFAVANRSYYIFYVSKIAETPAIEEVSVYDFFTSNNWNWTGWQNTATGAYPRFRTNDGNYIGTGNGKRYAINVVVRPNQTGGGALKQLMYQNGAKQEFEAKALNIPTGATYSAIGSADNGYALPFIGDIHEIIVLSDVVNRQISVTDLVKINSYLAIKYGITLTADNYVNSAAEPVWIRSRNFAYNNNIFGIARDNHSGLYQKQSTSSDKSTITVYLPNTTLTTLNTQNGGNLNDMVYLMFGSNAQEGYVSYDPTVAGHKNLFPTAVNLRTKEVFKTQLTASIPEDAEKITVNIKLNENNASYLLVSADPAFPFTGVTIYPLDAQGVAQNVVLKDGEYISFATYANAPGGVKSGLELWLKADDVNNGTLPSNGAFVTSWHDFSGKGRNHVQGTAGANNTNYPIFNTGDLMNYQPSVQFNNVSNHLLGPVYATSDRSYNVFYVSKVNKVTTGYTYPYSVYNFYTSIETNFVGWITSMTSNQPMFRVGNVANLSHQGNGKQYGINLVSRPNQLTDGRRPVSYLNGTPNHNAFDIRALTVGQGHSVVGSSNIGSLFGFLGNIQEIIVFSGRKNTYMDTKERAKVSTYLSLKYGITLEEGDYISSTDETVWSKSTNSGYNNEIFGVGRDDSSSLYIKQSTSYDHSVLTVFLGNDIANINRENTATLDNHVYLIFGTSSLDGVINYTYPQNTNFKNGIFAHKLDFRYAAEHKAQLTGANELAVNIKSHVSSDYIMVSSTNEFLPAQTDIYLLGSEEIARNVKIKDGDYIAYGQLIKQPSSPPQYDVELWLKADSGITYRASDGIVSAWNDISGKGHHFTTTAGVNYDTKETMNFHPSAKLADVGDYLRTPAGNNRIAISATKSYYTFLVSHVNEYVKTHAVAFNIKQNAGTKIGWNKGNPSFYTSAAATGTTANPTMYDQAGRRQSYGIISVIRPNTLTDEQVIYFNGNWQQKKPDILPTVSDYSVIGGNTAGSQEAFRGTIQEIIMITSDDQGQMDFTELFKVQSYLAIKYGLTLEIGDYYNSNGDRIWDRTKAVDNNGVTYYNAIFAVGRDDTAGGLYGLAALNQKQSTSYDGSPFVAFHGTLADLNADNKATIANNHFVFFSADQRIKNIKPLSNIIQDNTTFANGQSVTGGDLNYTSVTLKAQIYGGTTAVLNLKSLLNYPHMYLQVSVDPGFAAASTDLYEIDGTTKTLNNITITDGYYYRIVTRAGEAPGGVPGGLRVWLRADVADSIIFNANNSEQVYEWHDLSGNANHYTFADATSNSKVPPKFKTCDEKMNFNPAVHFEEYLATLAIAGDSIKNPRPMSVNAPDDFTSFVVYSSYEGTTAARLYTHGFGGTKEYEAQTRYPAMGFAPGAKAGRIRNEGVGQTDVNGTVKGYNTNTTAMHMIHTRKQAAPNGPFVIHDFGGWDDFIQPTGMFGNGFLMASGGTIGGASISDAQFTGTISEVFFYESELSQDEKDRIRTYLAMKYAITLDADGDDEDINYNYILSNGLCVWPGNDILLPNKKYHHSVAGLVRDDQSDLFINKAKSSAADAVVTMMIKGHNVCGQGLYPELKNNYSALYWGHNGDASVAVFGTEDAVCGVMESKLNKIWLVDNTNVQNQTVTIRVGNMSYFPYGGAGWDLFMLVANSEEKLKSNDWDMAIPATFINGEHQLEYTFKNKYTYFTFAGKAKKGVCETCSFPRSKKLSFKGWGRNALSHTYDLGDAFSATVSVTYEPNTKPYGVTPSVYGGKSLRIARRDDPMKLVTTTIMTSVPAAASFTISGIDHRAYFYDNVEVYGICNDGKGAEVAVSPKLKKVQNAYFDIVGNKAIVNTRHSLGEQDVRGTMEVDFPNPVQKIVIRYNAATAGRGSGVQNIVINPITYTCPQPLPVPPNASGLIFTKQAPTEDVSVCDAVTIEYRIYNVSCNPQVVNFHDNLPKKMEWAANSLSVDSLSVLDGAVVNSYGGSRIVNITNLTIPPQSDVLLRFEAIFDNSATTGTYESQATITYDYIDDNSGVKFNNEVQVSCDRFTAGCAATAIKAIGNPADRKKQIDTKINIKRECFSAAQDFEVVLEIKNENATISDVLLELSFSEHFAMTGNFVTSAGFSLGTPSVVQNPVNGMYSFENITLPAGTHTVTFKVKSPDKKTLNTNYLAYDKFGNILYDTKGNPIIADLEVAFNLSVDTNDACISNVFLNANGTKNVPYCSFKDAVISNKHVSVPLAK
jgi:hypothetical protein